MKLLFELSLGSGSLNQSTYPFPYGLAAIGIITSLLIPQTSKLIEEFAASKAVRGWISPANVSNQKKDSQANFNSNAVFPLKGYSAKTVKYSGFVGDCRPLGSCTRSHAGVDIPAPVGTPVLAVMDGVISEVKPDGSVGGVLGIESGKHKFRYVHISRRWTRKWEVGDKVKAGEQIAVVDYEDSGWGSGAHLHFEHYLNGELDKHPEKWLKEISFSTFNISNKNLKAFLDTIAWAETGTAGNEGYKVLVFNGKFSDFSSHPKTKQCASINGKRICSTAAGRYQMMDFNWRELQPKLGLKDFSPASQDRMAIHLIKKKGALPDVLAGRFEVAAHKVGGTWASFPNNSYGQNPKSMQKLKSFYLLRLK